MNILYVAPDIPVPHTGEFVGGSTHVMKIAESLAKRDNNVLIVSRRMKSQKKYERISENIFTRRVYRGLIFPIRGKTSSKEGAADKFWSRYKFVEKTYFLFYRFVLFFLMLYLLKKHKIDVILDRSSSKGIGAFSGFLLRKRTIVELLDPDYSKLSLKLADKVVVYTKRIVNPNLHDKVEIVSAGVDTDVFKPSPGDEVRKKYGLKDKKVVVYVGAMSAWHGAEDLIDVAAKLNEDIRFLMIGKNLEILGEKAKEKGVSSKFIFAGFVRHEDVPKYITAGDVAVAPYNPKGFGEMERYGFYFSPIKIFEYMACGKPVVATDLEIIRDIINENRCGLLTKLGDAGDFAEKIKMLLGNEALIKQFGENGRNAAIEKYTWDRVAHQIYKMSK